ncbi:hypothetical protein MAPG_00402 [Magnaporthiopsis poae ATCC 64411]|uniref:Integral membrane protein n=1 Tax=Magnaporthiopsis poae (strain ATCC 64411 / 73-15) TaxID=644358 RepID=A0A0C4DKX0_MAGP6|nr:hypothetical protein MAPG_00402 [Magnaporthiopsis poae ATCC 64411]
MGNFGRYLCVALPFLLTLASLISLLIAGLAGAVGNKDGLYMFRVNLTELQVKPNVLGGLVGRSPEPLPQAAPLIAAASGHFEQKQANQAGNITAADLGLHKVYDVNLWGYCFDPQNGDRSCLQPKFNWAETEVNNTIGNIKKLASTVGKKVDLPKTMEDALQSFGSAIRWTEIVFIIAALGLGVALLLGIISNCSRAVSCLTWVVSGVASAAVCAFAALATSTAVIVVGTAESTAKLYGVRSSFNGQFLATIWISVAFALAAGFFWLLTICCCKPESRRRSSDAEKRVPVGAYSPLNENQSGAFQNNSSYYHNQYGAPRYPQGGRGDMAYEPYSQGR